MTELLAPEQRYNTDDYETKVMRNNSEVDHLGRDEDTPVTNKGGNVCLT